MHFCKSFVISECFLQRYKCYVSEISMGTSLEKYIFKWRYENISRIIIDGTIDISRVRGLRYCWHAVTHLNLLVMLESREIIALL